METVRDCLTRLLDQLDLFLSVPRLTTTTAGRQSFLVLTCEELTGRGPKVAEQATPLCDGGEGVYSLKEMDEDG